MREKEEERESHVSGGARSDEVSEARAVRHHDASNLQHISTGLKMRISLVSETTEPTGLEKSRRSLSGHPPANVAAPPSECGRFV